MKGSISEGTISDDALFHGDLLKTRRSIVRVLHSLSENTLVDDGGRATSKIARAAGINTSLTGVTAVLKQMELDGWIERVVNGKRTNKVSLNCDNVVVKRLIWFFDNQEPEPVEIPETVHVEQTREDTSIVDAAAVADELLSRVVEILNSPTNGDIQKRLGEQIEYAQNLRARCEKQEKEIEDLKVSIRAKNTRIVSLQSDNERLESNLRAALKQERQHHGKGFRALEKFMQERPNGKR